MKRIHVPNSAYKAGLLVFLFLLAGCELEQARATNDLQANLQPGDHERSLMVDGRDRSYIVHVPPAYTGQNPLPLVIVLHAGGGNAEGIMTKTGMSDKA